MVSLSADPDWTRQPFHLHSRDIVKRQKEGLLIDADVLFEGVRGKDESVAISKAIGDWVKLDDPRFFKALDQANRIRTAILEAEVVAYEIDAEADDNSVIEIFARLNQQGVRLKPGDLAAARLTGKMKGFRSMARTLLTRDDLKGFASVEGLIKSFAQTVSHQLSSSAFQQFSRSTPARVLPSSFHLTPRASRLVCARLDRRSKEISSPSVR